MTEPMRSRHEHPSPNSGYLCPSGCCEEGAILLGVVGTDGLVGYVSPRTTVNAHFVQRVQGGGALEQRFRFAQPCIESQCRQWSEARCGIIDRVLSARDETGEVPACRSPLPQCSIRRSCRWFAQHGPGACEVCPFVVTDARGARRVDDSDLTDTRAVDIKAR